MLTECEAWVCVDAEGQYAVGTDADSAREAYETDVGELQGTDGFRLVKVTVKVPLPVVIEAAAQVAEDEPAAATAQ